MLDAPKPGQIFVSEKHTPSLSLRSKFLILCPVLIGFVLQVIADRHRTPARLTSTSQPRCISYDPDTGLRKTWFAIDMGHGIQDIGKKRTCYLKVPRRPVRFFALQTFSSQSHDPASRSTLVFEGQFQGEFKRVPKGQSPPPDAVRFSSFFSDSIRSTVSAPQKIYLDSSASLIAGDIVADDQLNVILNYSDASIEPSQISLFKPRLRGPPQTVEFYYRDPFEKMEFGSQRGNSTLKVDLANQYRVAVNSSKIKRDLAKREEEWVQEVYPQVSEFGLTRDDIKAQSSADVGLVGVEIENRLGDPLPHLSTTNAIEMPNATREEEVPTTRLRVPE